MKTKPVFKMFDLWDKYGKSLTPIVNQNHIDNILTDINRQDLIGKHANQWLYIDKIFDRIRTLYYTHNLVDCIPLVLDGKIYKEKENASKHNK